RFDPEQCLADIAEHGCDVLVAVPVMLQRILELPEEVRRRYDTGTLRAVCASGSALPGDLALRWMDEFVDNLYNLYGSTEVSAADVGRVDEAGRLFVSGRDDEMIVSGGENVFPKEVEDVLAGHEAVAEAAAIGVEDEKFGQRLRAFVVLKPGAGATAKDLQDH